MNERAVVFQRIVVDRALGIRGGAGFALEDLSPGINIVHGPNASGKSTTALVIHKLLAPHLLAEPSIAAAAVWLVGEQRWDVEVDGTRITARRDGRPVSPPFFRETDLLSRYRLALTDLLVARDEELARSIVAAGLGGFSLEAVAKAMSTPSVSIKGLLAQFDKKTKELRELRQMQQQVAAREVDLAALRKRREASRQARERITLLREALRYRQALARRRELERKLAALPDSLVGLREDDGETLHRIATRLKELAREQREVEDRIAAAERTLAQTGLPADGIAAGTVGSLRADQRRLAVLEQELREARRALREAEAAERSARERLGSRMGEERLAALASADIPELTAYAEHWFEVRAARHVLDRRRRELQEELAGDEPPAAADLVDGIRTLRRWLVGAEAVAGAGRPWLVPTAVVLAGLVLALVRSWWWGAPLLGFAAGLLVAGRWRGGRVAAAREQARRHYLTLGLASPAAWTVEAVEELARHLQELLDTALRRDRARQRLVDLDQEEHDLAAREQALAARRQDVERRLGLRPDETREPWLPLLLDDLRRWRQARAAVEGSSGAVAGLEQEIGQLLAELAEELARFGYEAPAHAERAAADLDDLDRRRQEHAQARQAIAAARDRLRAIAAERESQQRQRAAIHRRLGIDDEGEHQVAGWLEQLPDYKKLTDQVRAETIIIKEIKEEGKVPVELLEAGEDDLQREIEEQEALAGEYEDLADDVAAIERDLAALTGGTSLADARAALEAARAELADARDAHIDAILGTTLVEWLRREALGGAVVPVLHRAADLLARFTGGALKLLVDDRGGDVRFRVIAPDRERELDELSAGERVQVLLAVRLAFLEENENVALPLLLDETLGTSDDKRAAAIMDAVVSIADAGRQVFVFTAQSDEVGKWRARLERANIPHQVIDLAAVRRLQWGQNHPLPTLPPERPVPPSPMPGESYDAYGRRLGVGRIDPWAGVAEVHPWYLLDDPVRLYELLTLEITTWGQWWTYLESADDEPMRRAAMAAARAAEQAIALWRRGRGNLVDREVLEQWNKRTAKLDALTDLARTVGGDAKALLEHLEDQDKRKQSVPGWQERQTESLRDFLIEHGYFDPQPRLSREEIRLKALAFTADDRRAGLLTEEIVGRIIAGLPD